MSIIANEVQSLHTTLSFLYDMTSKQIHQRVVEAIQDTNIQVLAITIIPGEVGITTLFGLDYTPVDDGMALKTDECFTQREDGTYDIAEFGNASIDEFLKCGIEWAEWNELVEDLNENLNMIASVFQIDVDNGHNQLVITREKFWLAQYPYEQPKDAE